jgi:hypothetical protein
MESLLWVKNDTEQIIYEAMFTLEPYGVHQWNFQRGRKEWRKERKEGGWLGLKH